MRADSTMKFLRRLLTMLKGSRNSAIPRHTPEELEVFKRDAIENRKKHY